MLPTSAFTPSLYVRHTASMVCISELELELELGLEQEMESGPELELEQEMELELVKKLQAPLINIYRLNYAFYAYTEIAD